MKYPGFKYVDYAIGGLEQRNNIMDINKIDTPKGTDCYISYFRFNDSFQRYFDKTGDVSKYKGIHYSDYIRLDVNGKDLQGSLERVRNILHYLDEMYGLESKSLRLFFSGCKGFHIEIPAEFFGFEPSDNLYRIHRAIVGKLFDFVECNSNIYEIHTLWRVPNTKNSKSGLYKIYLGNYDIFKLSIEKIKKIANKPIDWEFKPVLELNPFLSELYEKCKVEESKIPHVSANYKSFKESSERISNDTIFDKEDNFDREAISQEEVVSPSKSLNSEYLTSLLSDRKVKTLSKTVYRNNDGKPKKSTIPLAEYLLKKYKRDSQRNGYLLGYKLNKFSQLAKYIEGIQPGFYLVVAHPNIGKTAFLVNIFLDILFTNPETSGIYFSFNDPQDIVIERFVSYLTDLPINSVKRKQENPEIAGKIYKVYRSLSELANSSRLDIKDISEIDNVIQLENEIELKAKNNLFVVIDGLYNLKNDPGFGGFRENNIDKANKVKALADIYKIPIIGTGELQKRNKSEKFEVLPPLDDLLETEKFAYNADVVWYLHPKDWEKFKQEDDPIIKLIYAKNKLSVFRGYQEIIFIKDTSIMIEVKPILEEERSRMDWIIEGEEYKKELTFTS